ncbi:uncharacterized protein PSFLO_07179 [Pseudozyma flocculosa]|uniref:Uncharacterized protein n=1 Tax=Pseudozyma flocculosa TaxID=84751 RepID=A0A5C3FDJ0_9BASI|nr:uncharacterized protein PSFLO_07179 [Pseudozyma flocculosa]
MCGQAGCPLRPLRNSSPEGVPMMMKSTALPTCPTCRCFQGVSTSDSSRLDGSALFRRPYERVRSRGGEAGQPPPGACHSTRARIARSRSLSRRTVVARGGGEVTRTALAIAATTPASRAKARPGQAGQLTAIASGTRKIARASVVRLLGGPRNRATTVSLLRSQPILAQPSVKRRLDASAHSTRWCTRRNQARCL